MSDAGNLTGGCHCGGVRYEIAGEPINHTLCHCVDCRRSTGAPMVGWLMVEDGALTVEGEASVFASSEDARRHFCIQCGTALFYTNDALLPGLIDITSASLDEPERATPECHIQTAERIGWMKSAHELPDFERYPPQD